MENVNFFGTIWLDRHWLHNMKETQCPDFHWTYFSAIVSVRGQWHAQHVCGLPRPEAICARAGTQGIIVFLAPALQGSEFKKKKSTAGLASNSQSVTGLPGASRIGAQMVKW